MIVDERRRIVQAGYDVLGPAFLEWGDAVEGDPRERFAAELAARLPAGASVLGLGCGGGTKTRRLAERWRGRGVASALKRTAFAFAAAEGIRAVYTWTQRGNHDMRRLNEHLGYVTWSESITMQATLPLP